MTTHPATQKERTGNAPDTGLQTQIAVGAAVFAVLLAISGVLWARFGEAVYIERILGAIASCF